MHDLFNYYYYFKKHFGSVMCKCAFQRLFQFMFSSYNKSCTSPTVILELELPVADPGWVVEVFFKRFFKNKSYYYNNYYF